MNSKIRKVEIQDDSSDEFPIREPGKTWAIKPAKSYWQQVPVTQYNSGGKSSYIQKNKQRFNFNPDAMHSRINFNPKVTSMPLASTSRQDSYKDQAKDKSRLRLRSPKRMAYSPPNSFSLWRNKARNSPSSSGTPCMITPIRSPTLDLCASGMYSNPSIYDPVIPGVNASMRTYRSRTPASSSSLSTGYIHSDWSQGDKKSGLRMTPISLQTRTR